MGTPKQDAANRLNAQKSTGPKTEEGKRRSARNAMKHGLTAKAILTDDECPQRFRAELDDWHAEFAGAGPVERALIETAMSCQYQLRRAQRSEAANANKRMRELRVKELAAEHARVEELGRKLRRDPLNRCAFFRKDPRTLAAMDEWLEDDPPVLVRELETTRTGVMWLQAQWEELATTLEREGYWHYNEKFFAIRLLGRRHQDLYEQFGIGLVFAACNVAHIEGWDLVHESIQSNLGIVDHPTYYQRIDSLRRFFPESREAAVDVLRRLVESELRRLDRLRREVVDPLHEADELDAPQRALLDDAPPSLHAHRYITSARNTLLRATGQLVKTYPGPRASVRGDYTPPDLKLLYPMPAPEPEPEPQPDEPVETPFLLQLRAEGMEMWRKDPTPYNPIEPRDDLATRREDRDPSDPRYFTRWRPEPDVESQHYLPPGAVGLRNEPNARPEVDPYLARLRETTPDSTVATLDEEAK